MVDKSSIIIILLIITVFTSLGVYIDYSNKQYNAKNWYQNGEVIKIYIVWGDVRAVIEKEDGGRTVEYCSYCLVGDIVKLKMNDKTTIRVIDLVRDDNQW